MIFKCQTNYINNNLKENADNFEPSTYLPVFLGTIII